ncbi:MAG: hypothetical protein R3B45_06995 [Bdellovibrionota bacterium]
MSRIRYVFILLIVFMTYSHKAFASSVVKVIKKKGIVIINEGKSSGIEKKAKVCFLSKKGKKITCGVVVKVKNKSAYVKVKSKKRIAKIKKGFEAQLADASAATSTSKSVAEKSENIGGSGPFMAIRLLGTPAIIAQTTYDKIIYDGPESSQGAAGSVTTLWSPKGSSNSAIFSLGMEVDLVKYGAAVGGRYRLYKAVQAEANFTKDNDAQYVQETLEGSALGFYLDYYFIKPAGFMSGLRLGAGLDIDMSTVKLTVNQLEDELDTNNELYNATSTLTVISLRVPVGYHLAFGAMGLDLGANILLPVVGDSPTLSLDTQDPNTDQYAGEDDSAKTAATQDDISKSLAHSKSSFAIEVIVGLSYSL